MLNKISDNEIVKALKEILEIMLTMGDLQKSATISNALDLINRQKADLIDKEKQLQEALKRMAVNKTKVIDLEKEINRLQAEIERLRNVKSHIDILIHRGVEYPTSETYNEAFQKALEKLYDNDNAKAEAYKEFAERFVTELVDTYDLKSMQIGNIEKIKNNLLKEMEGGASEVED